MTTDTLRPRDHGFLLGLLTGTVVGAGLTMWFAPRVAAELRERVTDSAKALRTRATERYDDVSTRVEGAVDELTRKGRDVRDDMADAVARGANEVARQASAIKTDHTAETKKRGTLDGTAPATHSL